MLFTIQSFNHDLYNSTCYNIYLADLIKLKSKLFYGATLRVTLRITRSVAHLQKISFCNIYQYSNTIQ